MARGRTLNAKGSLFLTRPRLAAHATDLDEYRRGAKAVFEAVRAGVIAPAATAFALSDATAAHQAIEAGLAKGAVILRA